VWLRKWFAIFGESQSRNLMGERRQTDSTESPVRAEVSRKENRRVGWQEGMDWRGSLQGSMRKRQSCCTSTTDCGPPVLCNSSSKRAACN